MSFTSAAKKTLKYFGIAVLLVIVVCTSALAVYRQIARHKIADSRAIHTPDGIEVLESVSIGGIQQWIEIRGESARNPVLLFIHGGPGSAFMPIARSFQGPWESRFTVVQWDQRGAGKTYSANSKDVQRKSMNIDRMHADALEMVNFLRSRFQRDKIFVLGHSWGSILGLRLAHDHPELLYAYVGVGQATNSWQNEAALFRDTLEEARRTGNKEAVQKLTSIAPYPSPNVTFQQIRIMREWSGSLIGPSAADDSFLSLKGIFLAPEYSLINDVDWLRGQLFSVDLLLRELTKVNFDELGYDYRVPIFFLEGRRDPYTPSTVAKEFFDKMNAPEKEFVWFEKSGHFPFAEEANEFTGVLTRKVLPLASPGASQRSPNAKP